METPNNAGLGSRNPPYKDDWTWEQNRDQSSEQNNPEYTTVVTVSDPQAQRIADLTQANNQMQTALIDMREEVMILKNALKGLRSEINATPTHAGWNVSMKAATGSYRTITVSATYVEWLNKLNLD